MKAPLLTILIITICTAIGCDDCPDKALIGPGFLQSSLDDYNLFSSKDTIKYQNFDGAVKVFTRLRPEEKSMQIRTDHRTVRCVENEDKTILLSSELERIDNIFISDDQDTISVGLRIINFNLFDPFEFDEHDLTSFPVYLTINIYLSDVDRNLTLSGYIAYQDNRDGEPPVDWINLNPISLDTPIGPTIEDTYRFRFDSGFIYYKKDQGLVGFTFFTNSRWRILE